MKIKTKFLGEVDIEEKEILTFSNGLPGFVEYKKYILLALDQDLPIVLLQSVENESISFVLAFPFAFKPDYAFDLNDADIEELQVDAQEDILTYSIVTLKETLSDSTMNLLAPIVINKEKKLAKQIVLNESTVYPLKYPLNNTVGTL